KQHTVIGGNTLRAVAEGSPTAQFLKMAQEIALTHHERFDGNGYPKKLAGEGIPLCGRIVALADVYDAMRSKRVYKSAFSHEKVRETIVEESGKHFDPDVVQAFLNREEEFIAVAERFQDDAPVTLRDNSATLAFGSSAASAPVAAPAGMS